MKKYFLTGVIAMLAVLFITGGAFAEKQRINRHNVQNPQTLEKLLNAIDTEIDLIRAAILTRNMANATLAEGTAAQTIKTTVATDFAIGGVLYTKAIADDIAMTALSVQAVSTYCLYLVSINAGGDVAIAKGTAVASDIAKLPAIPASQAMLGYFKVVTDADTTFTCGTDDITTFVGNGGAVTFYNTVGAVSGPSAVTEQTTRGK